VAQQLVEDEDVGLPDRVDARKEREQPGRDELVRGEQLGVFARSRIHGIDEVR
jgi:hypothetical protein